MKIPPRMNKRLLMVLTFVLALPNLMITYSPSVTAAAGSALSTGLTLENPGFELGDLTGWTVTGATYAAMVKNNSEDAHSGSHSFNYWYGDHGYEFRLSQTLSGLENGTYELRAWASGKDEELEAKLFAETGGVNDGDEVGGEDAGSSSGVTMSTKIVNNGWNVWKEYKVEDIQVTDGRVTIGFEVAAPADYWGYFDDIQLVKSGEEAYDPNNFIKGVDISTLQALEELGVQFYDDGSSKDLLTILKDHGVNYVRLRLWNDPVEAGGFNDREHTVEMATRVKAAGLKLLLDFHYSDFWADPGKQVKPAAWEGLDFPALKQAVYDYTSDVLTELGDLNAYPDMIQIGNEINSGMIHPEGSTANFDNLAELLNQGSQAVRDTTPEGQETKIMLHLAEGGSNGKFRSFFDQIKARGVDYDVIGLSYYPYWHGTFQDLKSNMNDLVARYGKQVVVAETAYPYTYDDGDDHGNIAGEAETDIAGFPASVANQKLVTETVLNTVASVDGHNGLGVFYWEPAWLPGVGWKAGEGNAWENQAMFDFGGNALASLDAFRFVPGSITEVLPLLVYAADGVTVSKGTTPVLPAKVNVLYNEGSIRPTAVLWDGISEELLTKPGKFTVYGQVAGIEQQARIEITVLEKANMLQNPGFESGDLTHWTISGTSAAGKVEKNAGNAHSGSHAFNYWYGEPYGYQLTQNVSGLSNGTYTLKAWASGGGGETKLKLFATDSSGKMQGTDMLNTGWNVWKQYAVENIQVEDGRLTIGFEVEAPEEIWGYFDDVELIQTAEAPTMPTNPTTPAEPSNPQGGGTSGGLSSNTGNPGVKGPESKPATLTIKPDQMKRNGDGIVSIDVSEQVSTLILTGEVIKSLGNSALEVSNGNLKLNLPNEVLQQLIGETAKSADYSVSLQFAQGDKQALELALGKGTARTEFTSIEYAGPMYDFKLSLLGPDGTEIVMDRFVKPVTISIKPNTGVHKNTTGIYYISEGGNLEFAGGRWIDGEVTAELSHFSPYAVLQVTKQFVDVSDTNWAYEAVAGLAAKQVVKGTANGAFEPGRPVSRAEFVAMLTRGLRLEPGTAAGFTDVASDAWYSDAVSAAYNAGIIKGRAAKAGMQFDPNAPVTRQEMAVMLMNAYALKGTTSEGTLQSGSFADEDKISDWANSAIKNAYALGLVQGRGDGGFAPTEPLTRAEAAQAVYQLWIAL